MFLRVAIAVTGAAVVTGGMLFGMNEVAKTFRERDPTRYFRITDVIIPEGRRRPRRPPEAQLPPAREPLQHGVPDKRPTVDAPRLDVAPPLEEPDIRPRIGAQPD